jgi:hypothetical protein
MLSASGKVHAFNSKRFNILESKQTTYIILISAMTPIDQFQRGISFTVDKNLHENQRLSHVRSINAFRS